jgi:hypothetical protein
VVGLALNGSGIEIALPVTADKGLASRHGKKQNQHTPAILLALECTPQQQPAAAAANIFPGVGLELCT